jgi:hypothetical protein
MKLFERLVIFLFDFLDEVKMKEIEYKLIDWMLNFYPNLMILKEFVLKIVLNPSFIFQILKMNFDKLHDQKFVSHFHNSYNLIEEKKILKIQLIMS